MRSTTRRRSDTSPVKKLFLLAFAVVYTLVVCLGCFTNTDANGLVRERRRSIIGEDEGFFFVSANPGGAEEDDKLLRLELELEKAKSDLSHARKEKRSVEEKLNVDLNEMRRTKREVELLSLIHI